MQNKKLKIKALVALLCAFTMATSVGAIFVGCSDEGTSDTNVTQTEKYTVTFNVNGHGTAPSSQSVTEGGKASNPTAPTATGYTFGGWYKEAACTTAWNFNTDTVTADTTLYAKWTAVTITDPDSSEKTYPYTITIDSSGGVTDADGNSIYKDGTNYNVDKSGNVYADPGSNVYGSGSFDATVSEWAVDTGETRGTSSYGGGAVIITFDKQTSADANVEMYYVGDVYNNGGTSNGCSATFYKDGTCTLVYKYGPRNYTYTGTWTKSGNTVTYSATAS